ncbi:uncharacterized protein LOC112690932 [Sipha flava]|uniref:Uncharacterized protein LOC112690932 n=1 Tax=Sipha flava TaxID=143950 RepID=A0A8B8GDS8_9HEMI|nr:uncharacterized protein LOC112690932 [Sipha flava]
MKELININVIQFFVYSSISYQISPFTLFLTYKVSCTLNTVIIRIVLYFQNAFHVFRVCCDWCNTLSKMDDHFGWIVVEFCDDENVEVVSNFWLKNNSCAWPKASKQAKKYIQKRIKPNMNDFIFYKSRLIGNKVYNSYNEAKRKLPLAIHKSDLSSADDIIGGITKRKRKCPYEYRGQSLSPTLIMKSKKLKVNNYVSQSAHSNKEINNFESSDNSNDASYDSDKDPLWKIDKSQRNSVIDGINCITPVKNASVLVNKPIDNTEHIIPSPVGTWTVEKYEDTQLLYKTSSDRSSIKVKKVLFCDQIIDNSESSTTADVLKLPQDTNISQNQSNISDVMANKNTSAKDIINLDSIFPIKTHGELESLEIKIKADENFKNTLITQLSVLIDINDLGNSVRRIVSRMLSDVLLSEYSLYGFKSKLCFSSLHCYRVIIDAIRVNVKYSVVPEKEIDNSLGIWLSHAPFRIKKLISKKRKTLQNSFFKVNKFAF